MSNRRKSRSPTKNGPILVGRPTRGLAESDSFSLEKPEREPERRLPITTKRKRLTIDDARRGGRVRSPRKAAAVRIAAWRHGGRAKSVSLGEVIARPSASSILASTI